MQSGKGEQRAVVRKAIALAGQLAKDTSLSCEPLRDDAYVEKRVVTVSEIKTVYTGLVRDARTARYLATEVEWLFENFYLIEAAVADIHQSVRRADLKKLPHVSNKKNYAVVRVYYLLSKLLTATDNEIDAEILTAFLHRYQKEVPLSVRELDMLPGMLKLVLVSRMRTVMVRMSKQTQEYGHLEAVIEDMRRDLKSAHPLPHATYIDRLSLRYATLSPQLGLRLMEELNAHVVKVRPLIKWLRLHFLKQGISMKNLTEVVGTERDRVLTVAGNIMGGLRWISQVRWNDYLEGVDMVEHILRGDPSGEYGLMNQEGRGVYRRKILRVAEATGVPDTEVARLVVRLAKRHVRTTLSVGIHEPEAHVGYYLVDAGVSLFEREAGYAPQMGERLHRLTLAHASALYFGAVAFLTILLVGWTATFSPFTSLFSESAVPIVLLLTLLFLIIWSEMVIALVNLCITLVVPVRRIFSLDLHAGIGASRSTCVVVPTMVRTDVRAVTHMLNHLETVFVGNRDPHIHFALLLDFQDAPSAVMPYDDEAVQRIREGIDALNAKYSPDKKIFSLFHRKRLWNHAEGVYMGWERKRGKLFEFNRLLRGATDTSYVMRADDEIPNARYVVTLDEDTAVPREAVMSLVGSIDHSLNRAHVDAETGMVTRGYGIVQPSIRTRMGSAHASIFSRLYASAVGIDSYSGPNPDVYQDLFGEGLFIGKGIYDVDVVLRTLRGRIPENLVLSHDLLEGLYARTGYASHVQFFDGFPTSIVEFAMRHHRWIRGDWQIVRWLWTDRPHLGGVARWKIFDNLRRSTVSLSLVLVLLLSFRFDTFMVLAATLFPFVVYGVPAGVGAGIGLISGLKAGYGTIAGGRFVRTIRETAVRILMQTVFLMYDAYISASAIILALVRTYVTRRHLLQWTIASDVAGTTKDTLGWYLRALSPVMGIALALGVLYLGIALRTGSPVSPIVLGWVTVWCGMGVFAFLVSRASRVHTTLTPQETVFLRTIACRTARFFYDFANRKNNYLIPDHFQPRVQYSGFAPGTITSSTNIGMMLLSFFLTYRLGYSGLHAGIERIRLSLNTISSLPRYRGHLYNWYDIHKLIPVGSKYVSSADSANMVIALVTLRQGLLSTLNEPVVHAHARKQGWCDATRILVDDTRDALRGSLPQGVHRLLHEVLTHATHAHRDLMRTSVHSVSSLLVLASELEKYILSIGVIIEQLRLQTDTEKVTRVYASAEYLRGLHQETLHDIETLLPFCQGAETIRREYRAWAHDAALAPLCEIVSTMVHQLPTLSSLTKGHTKETLAHVDIPDAVASSTLTPKEKEVARHLFSAVFSAWGSAHEHAQVLCTQVHTLADTCDLFITECDFTFLYNKERGLFHIGYNGAHDVVDNSYYDFLASESNLVSFVASLSGQSRARQWFNLGRRTITLPRGGVALSSWGGSLFEYLTPMLFFRAPRGSILDEAAHRAIASQMRHAKTVRTPWGMGESACSKKNVAGDYHYQIYGDPALGFMRGLSDATVVAPYTTVLATMYTPHESVKNLTALVKDGAFGPYGFYDAVEYTDGHRWLRKRAGTVAEIYYAHHLGFTLAALVNTLEDNAVRTLFHADARVKSTEHVLEETFPTSIPLVRSEKKTTRIQSAHARAVVAEKETSEFVPALPRVPRIATLSNGTFSTVIDSSGVGWSSYKRQLITKRTSDTTHMGVGMCIYVRHEKTGEVWSMTHAPDPSRAHTAKVVFSENVVEFSRRNGAFTGTMRVRVDPKDPLEVRTVTLKNESAFDEPVELVSYGEMVLASAAQDAHHPLFHKLFVRTERDEAKGVVYFERRATFDRQDKPLHVAHAALCHSDPTPATIHAVTREHFLGRGGSYVMPESMKQLSREGERPAYTLDPVASLARRVVIPAGGSVSVTFLTIAARHVDEVRRILETYKKRFLLRTLLPTRQMSAEPLYRMGIVASQLRTFRRLLSGIMTGEYLAHRAPAHPHVTEPLVHVLWRHGISGDLPLFVVHIMGTAEVGFVRSCLLFWKYAQFKGVDIDMVIMNNHPTSYDRTLENDIGTLVRNITADKQLYHKGNVLQINTALLHPDDIATIEALAHARMNGQAGTFEKQVRTMSVLQATIPKKHVATHPSEPTPKDTPRPKGLVADNGYGGFDPHTGAYVMYLNKTTRTPVPWTNIIAHETFGTLVSNSGASYTWSGDSYDNRLTAWYNDPLIEKSGEAFYIRDEESGDVWSPTPFPLPTKQHHVVRHGAGYSSFACLRRGIQSTLTMCVPRGVHMKLCHFSLTNHSHRVRTLSVTSYTEPVLGALREHSVARLTVAHDAISGALVVRNRFRNHFTGRVMFLSGGAGCAYTADRREFIGPCGTLAHPAALKRATLSGSTVCDDPCAAVQKTLSLNPGETLEYTVCIGEAPNEDEMRAGIAQYTETREVHAALNEVEEYWKEQTGAFVFETPDVSLNLVANHWLAYQNLSARVFARTGYYQPSGAFGFRDQLQDVAAFVWTKPALLRAHILDASAHQFREGDAMNWWHTHNNFGLRSTIADHHLWLVWAVVRYVEVTGDRSILDERVPFLSAPVPNEIERQWTGIPEVDEETATVFEHCVRALDRSMTQGPHGMPLMGGGDWNDGLNRVGDDGKGESTWLAWFIMMQVRGFVSIAGNDLDATRIERFTSVCAGYLQAVETHAWDGAWYRRAFLDNGAPLGSSTNHEFQIDSIAQSYAVLGGSADTERARKAMDSVANRLFSNGLLPLIHPPIDSVTLDIGYLASYPPGVRENGAQYDHAALWAAQAFAKVGDAVMLERVLGAIHPSARSDTREKVAQYRVEPYVIASDIYAEPSYSGRGGWTWYTGSAGVMYSTLVEYVFGLKVRGDSCRITPTLPASWHEATLTYHYKSATYRIHVVRETVQRDTPARGDVEGRGVWCDGVRCDADVFPLRDDHTTHAIEVVV